MNLTLDPALAMQLTMLPEVTNYVANGPAGPAKLAVGPNLASYRGTRRTPSVVMSFTISRGTPCSA